MLPNEQSLKTRLLKVVIGRQGLRELVLLHHEKGDAIGKLPSLVPAMPKPLHALGEGLVRRRHNGHRSLLRDSLQKRQESVPPAAGPGKSVAHLQEDKLSRHG